MADAARCITRLRNEVGRLNLARQRAEGIQVSPSAGFDRELPDDALFRWTARMFDFPGSLSEDLQIYSQIREAPPELVVSITIPSSYPLSPPILSLVRPRLSIASRTCIDLGGNVRASFLSSDDWSPVLTLEAAIRNLRQQLIQSDARLSYLGADYTDEERDAAQRGLLRALRVSPVYAPADCGLVNLPQDVLMELERANMTSTSEPVLFCLSAPDAGESVAAGVGGFSADAGELELPEWMLRQLQCQPGDLISVRATRALPKATFLKFRVEREEEFLRRHPNARTMLEHGLSGYKALTQGATISVHMGGDAYAMELLEARPATSVSLHEVDVELEFESWKAVPTDAPPKDKEQEKGKEREPEPQNDPQQQKQKQKEPSPSDPIRPPAAAPLGRAVGPTAGGRECPNCGSTVPEMSFERHMAHCARLYARCTRCSLLIRREEMEQHTRDAHALVECPDCHTNGFDREETLPLHRAHECVARVVQCKYCEDQLRAAEMEAHEEYCGGRTDRCPYCAKFIRRREMSVHLVQCVEKGGQGAEGRGGLIGNLTSWFFQ